MNPRRPLLLVPLALAALAGPGLAEPAWKDLALGDSPPVSVSFGGHARARYEYFKNNAFGAGPQDPDGYLLWRAHLHSELRVGDSVRAFLEFKTTEIEGREGGARPPDQTHTDLHQAFLDFTAPDIFAGTLTARLGRQELAYGSARIIGLRDGPNTRLSFDAARLLYAAPALRLDAFVAAPVEIDATGSFNDRRIRGETVSGLYATLPERGLDLYALFSTEDAARYQAGLADEERVSLGARAFGRRGPWDYNFEGLYQFGDWGSASIRAWTLASDTGFTWTEAPWRPRLALKANVISGDDDPADDRLETFNALYPRGGYFGDSAIIGPANLLNLHPYAQLRPRDDLDLLFEMIAFWRHSTRDGVYNPGRALVRSGAGSDERFLGTQWNAQVLWRATRSLTLRLDYNHFLASDFWSETGAGEDIRYVGAQVQLNF
jgi:hypothetical protein